MNASVVISLVMAGLAVTGALGAVMALSFKVGKLVGKVETLITTSAVEHAKAAADVDHLRDRLNAHLDWHMRPSPIGTVPP